MTLKLMTRFRLILAIGLAMTCISRVEADSVESFAGLTFVLPSRFEPSPADPPASKVWLNEGDKLSVMLMSMPTKGEANANEYYDWPGVGRSFIAGVGQRQVKMYQDALGVKCSFNGTPIRQDLPRMVMLVDLTVSCATEPVSAFRVQLISAVTQSEQVLIRIDSDPDSPYADGVVQSIWQNLRNPTAPFRADKVRASASNLRPVEGGSGFRLRDYDLVAAPYLIGEILGGVAAALTFGAALVLLFLRLGMRPFVAVVVAQVLLTCLRIWTGNLADGVWELNWLVLLLSAFVGVFGLQGWAQRRWDRRGVRVAQT